MKILLLEPYFTGSHKSWCEGLQKYSEHEIKILSMPGRYWKWRMHAGAITLANSFTKLYKQGFKPELIFASDMLDLNIFLALTRTLTYDIPTILYFHENQLTYPWSLDDRDIAKGQDKHYGFINFASALASDHNYFNSSYHLNSFLNSLPNFLKHFPDYNELSSIDLIQEKSSVLHLGIDLSSLQADSNLNCNRVKANLKNSISNIEMYKSKNKVPVVLWNHRWEYDKNPKDFFSMLLTLEQDGFDFKLIILGEKFSQKPKEFIHAEKHFKSKIIKIGFADSRKEYAKYLQEADILPVTSNQDFFGISIFEALSQGCIPLLPNRLAYPEVLSITKFQNYFYSDNKDLVSKMKFLLQEYNTIPRKVFMEHAFKYNWEKQIKKYDGMFYSYMK